MSNSSKPFFVFWSLLAIPTLTILISDMGDTVVKGIKDATIWLGEVTVLPSSEDTLANRLKHGLYKGTLGQLDLRKTGEDVEQGSGDNDDDYQEEHPGLTRLFRNGRKKHKKTDQDSKSEDRLAAEFEETEKKDEDDARKKGEKWKEDEHHYRHVLISQLRKVYADAQAATPKKYTYDEWQYFLKLLGEDEEDAQFHQKAPTHGEEEREAQQVEANNNEERPTKKTQTDRADDVGRQGGANPGGKGGDDQNGQVTRWSWIGAQSPLMGDKEEAEWLLERFFQRLEESLNSIPKTKQSERGEKYATGLHDLKGEENGSNSSERTVSQS